tara:strand:- start:87 stop:380 length:294 start_codon:yes stop_codon:yes gene_type:complete
MEVFDLSGEDEEYLSIEEQEKLKDIKIFLSDRIDRIENKLDKDYDILLKKHQEDIKKIYDKIMVLEEKIVNIENYNNKGITDILEEIWQDFRDFVKV